MWKLEWIWEDCQWVIRNPFGTIVTRTYNRKVARQLLDKFVAKGLGKETNSDVKKETKNEEEDIRSDDQ